MKNKFLFTLIFIFLTTPVLAKIQGRVTQRYFSRQIKQVVFKDNGNNIARYDLDVAGNFFKKTGGPLNGNILVYHENGRLAARLYFVNGKVNDQAKFYFKDGRLEAEFQYKDNKKSGPYKIYYDHGGLQQEGSFILSKVTYPQNNNNLRIAKAKEKNILSRLISGGAELVQFEFDDKTSYSKPDGTIKSYQRDGSLEFEDIYDKGKLIKTIAYDRAGKISWERSAR
ncbi:toxin-antitoxin system YwqK family antitoxin [Candidatus Margulisiibacteriota bacterium]